MPAYQLFHPDTEILGQVILDFKKAPFSEEFHPIFEKHRLTQIEPEKWYPAQPWLDVLTEIANSPNGMMNLVSIGIAQLELAVMPPEFDRMPLIDKLMAIEDAYQLNYRGTDIGEIKVEVIGQNHVKLTIRSFEPDDLWYGNAHGMMRRFAPKGTPFRAYYDPDTPRREQGGEATIIHIEWEVGKAGQ